MLNNKDLEYISGSYKFWNKLNEKQKESFVKSTEKMHYKKGDRIYGGESDCVGVLLIKEGNFRVYLLSEEGKEVTLYREEKGDICMLSASCMLEQITFDVHIDAVTDCEVYKTSVPVYDNLCKENVYADNFTNKIIIDRFSDVMWAMQQILFMSFDKRLAIFLYEEAIRNKSNKIRLTHDQIAKYVASAREVVTRMLNYFVDEGIVKLSRGVVEVIDRDKLKEITY